jgi:hypothetical protein
MPTPLSARFLGLVGALLVFVAPLRAQTERGARIRLRADTVIDGVRCAPTGRAYAVLHANGALDECPLAIDTIIAGHALPRGTWLRLTEARGLDGAWLPANTTVQGVPCKGTGYKGWSVRFHADGALSLCYLSRAWTVDGIACRAAAFTTELTGSTQVQLDPDGHLHSCRLNADVVRGGVRFKRGQRVERAPDGSLHATR